MTQDHPSKLSFSIEESVWLNKGQEVAEILSMSLDPEIRIEEKNDHVVIKGGLRLLGEYRPVQNDAENTEEGEVAAFRSFEEVTLNDQNVGEIKHFFPIDVTIPLSRIQNIDDVYVQVETFDYDLPEKSCLQLTADVAISGMSTQQQEVKRPSYSPDPSYSPNPSYSSDPSYSEAALEREEQPSYYSQATSEMDRPSFPQNPSFSEELPEIEKPPSLQPFPSFSFEARKQAVPEPKAEEPVVEAKELVPAMEEPEYEQQYETPKFEVEGSEPIQNQEPVIPKQSPELNFEARPEVIEPEERNPIDNLVPNNQRSSEQATSFEQETVEEEERVESVEEVEQEEALEAVEKVGALQAAEDPTGREEEEGTKINFAPLKKLSERPPAAVEVEEEVAGHDQDDPAAEAVKAPKSRTDENALYLTKMLADGEEQFSKLKMCIIQENESLDTIAERYELSTSQIVRVNRLNEERVEEGQILYIPVGSKR